MYNEDWDRKFNKTLQTPSSELFTIDEVLLKQFCSIVTLDIIPM
jgi:hypothetical protein